MPTYTYKCTVCGHRFDGVAKMNDPAPACPAAAMSWQSWPEREGAAVAPAYSGLGEVESGR